MSGLAQVAAFMRRSDRATRKAWGLNTLAGGICVAGLARFLKDDENEAARSVGAWALTGALLMLVVALALLSGNDGRGNKPRTLPPGPLAPPAEWFEKFAEERSQHGQG